MKKLLIATLLNAYRLNKQFDGQTNERIIGEKQDVVTKGDIEIGDLIVKELLEDKSSRVIVESEEHGKQQNFEDGQEEYYIAIDDIDGSNNLRVGNGMLPYCSMIVVFKRNAEHEDYTFDDYAYAACIDHVSGRIFYTEKGLGFVEEYDSNGTKIGDSRDNIQDNSNLALTLSTDIVSSTRGGKTGYGKGKEVTASVLPSVLDGVYRKYAIVDSGCSVFEYAMTGMGIRNGYVSTGKKMHELPLLYAFCKETGQDMCDFTGRSYDEITYDFSGGDAEVVAGRQRTIEEICRMIQRQNEANERLKILIQRSLSSNPGNDGDRER